MVVLACLLGFFLALESFQLLGIASKAGRGKVFFFCVCF